MLQNPYYLLPTPHSINPGRKIQNFHCRVDINIASTTPIFEHQSINKMVASCKVPVIDLRGFPGQSSELVRACEEWGCFRIVNYGEILPASLMEEMKAVVRSLLDLPAEIKQRNTDVILGSGYMAPSKVNPHYEALGLYDIASPQAVHDFCTQLYASPQQRETIERYAKAVHGLTMVIVCKLADSLGLTHASFVGWPCKFRINKYNFTPETVGSPGVQVHTDSGFLTILQNDGVGGLEIMSKSGAFLAIDPCPGTLLVNLGDTAAAWSNGRFYNVKHRVQCKEAATRVSIASFLLGPKEAVVEPPPELVDSKHGRLYVPFTYEDYRKLRFSTDLQAGETLDLMRTTNN